MYSNQVSEVLNGFVTNYACTKLVGDGVLSIEFGENLKPVRKVVLRSNAKATGKWPSWKMGMVHYESENELNVFKLLDASPDVLSYYPQPCKIRYVQDGIAHYHIPDILVFFKDSIQIWEVKSLLNAQSADVVKRTDFMKFHLERIGYIYRLLQPRQSKDGAWFDNIEMILRRGRQNLSLLRREVIRQTFATHGTMQWGMFSKTLNVDCIMLDEVCRLILEGKLYCDLHAPVLSKTLVKASKEYLGVQR